MEEEKILTDNVKELILLLDKKNRLNSIRKNAQWRASYYREMHHLKKMKHSNLPKKYNSISLSDINLLILKNEADVLNSRIKILNFNKVFSNKIRLMCAENSIRINYSASNFASLHLCDYDISLTSSEISKIAKEYEATLAVEKMLTTKD